jgi:hypothetical protein
LGVDFADLNMIRKNDSEWNYSENLEQIHSSVAFENIRQLIESEAESDEEEDEGDCLVNIPTAIPNFKP